VNITIVDRDIINCNENFCIAANNIRISRLEAEELLEAGDTGLIEAMDAIAWVRSSNPREYVDVIVYETDFDATPGYHDVTFAVEEDQELQITPTIYVVDRDVLYCGEEFCIAANNIVIGTVQAFISTPEFVIDRSEAIVWNQDDLSIVSDIGVVDIFVIEPVPGIYQVVLYVVDEPETRITIDVEVADFHFVETFGDYAIGTNEVMMGRYGAIQGLASGETSVVDFSETAAWNRRTGESIEVEVRESSLAVTPAVYPITFGIVGQADSEITTMFIVVSSQRFTPEGVVNLIFPPRQ
jgi:hypothetical protein